MILNELIKIVDGRTMSKFIVEEISKPLGLDLYFSNLDYSKVSKTHTIDPVYYVIQYILPSFFPEKLQWGPGFLILI